MRSSKRSAAPPESGRPAPTPGRAPASTVVPPVPRRTGRPKWWDPRIVGGLLLVVVTVVVGARVIGASARTTPVWAAARDLAAGTVVTADDLVAVDVNLGATAGRYLLAAGTDGAVGRTVTAAVHGGELLPASAVTATRPGRVIVIGVAADRLPPGVDHGSSIDLYLTTGAGTGTTGGTTALIASGITVQSVASPSSGGLSGATSSRYQLAVLLDPTTADRLVRLLPTGDPLVVLVTG